MDNNMKNLNNNTNDEKNHERDANLNNEVKNSDNVNHNEDNDSVGDNINFTMVQDVEYSEALDRSPVSSESNNNYQENNNQDENDVHEENKKEKKTKKKGKSFGSYIAVALICSILGGGIGSGISYSLMKDNLNTAVAEMKKHISSSSSLGTTSLSAIGGVDIPGVVEKVSPAVVGVSTTSQVTTMFGIGREQEGLGSGVIFSEDGYVLTNYHVISGASQVKVILSTGQEVDAKVVNYDEAADLAVVKITENMTMPGVAELGDSSALKAGEQVIAIGNPLGKQYLGSVTTGIISAVSREVSSEDGTTMNLIQTDTAINSGNSGGPLINSLGQVIGINTAKIQATGVEGIGFAIPINAAAEKLDVLVKQKITLGVTVLNVTTELAKQYNLPEGIYIRRVEDFSIAQKGGLQAGDVITKFAGKEVKTVEELNEIKATFNDGDTMSVEFVRNGKSMTANLIAE